MTKTDTDAAYKRFPEDDSLGGATRYGFLEGIRHEREACARLADAAGELATGVAFVGKSLSDEVKVAVEATIRQIAKNVAEAIRSRTED